MKQSFITPKDESPSNLDRLKTTLQEVAADELLADVNRLERWIFDERTEASFVDRFTLTLWKTVMGSKETMKLLSDTGTSEYGLIKLCQEAIAQAVTTIDTSEMPTRNGQACFFNVNKDDINKTAPLSIEYSRDGTHKSIDEHRKVNEIITLKRHVLDEESVERIKKANSKADKPFLLDRLLAEWDRVGNTPFHFLATLRAGNSTRLNLSDKGMMSFQTSKVTRSTCVNEEPIEVDQDNLNEFVKGLESLGLTEKLVAEINANRQEFSDTMPFGKKTNMMVDYAKYYEEIKATGSTRGNAYIDMVSSWNTFMDGFFDDDVLVNSMGKTLSQLVNLNDPDYVPIRRIIFDNWRRIGKKTKHPIFSKASYEEIDGEIGKSTCVQGSYGIGGNSLGRTFCGLGRGDEPRDYDPDNYDVIAWLHEQDAKGVTIPNVVLKYLPAVNKLSDAKKYEAMTNLADSMLKSMKAAHPVMGAYQNICKKLWERNIDEDGCGEFPKTVSPLGYEFDPGKYRRNKDEWTRVGKSLGLCSFAAFDTGLLVNPFEFVNGTHLPPLVVHLTEASWMDLWILLCWELGGFVINPGFDGAGVPIGKLLEAHRYSIMAYNMVREKDTFFEQLGLPRRKNVTRLCEDTARILTME